MGRMDFSIFVASYSNEPPRIQFLYIEFFHYDFFVYISLFKKINNCYPEFIFVIINNSLYGIQK